MNEILLIAEILVVFSLLVLSKKLFGKNGVVVWFALATVLANIQTAKSIDLFGFTANLGTVLFASTFLASDILNECYEKRESAKAIMIGVFSTIVYLITTQIFLAYEPGAFDFVDSSMQTAFAMSPRICIASIMCFLLANVLNAWVFDKLKQKHGEKKLWLRNNVSTILCNGIENALFILISFYGVFSGVELLSMILSMTIIEMLVSVCGTPFMYLAKRVKGAS